MNKETMKDFYKFVAALSVAHEHFMYFKDAAIEFEVKKMVEEMGDKIKGDNLSHNRKTRKYVRNRINQHRNQVKRNYEKFEKTIYSFLGQFEDTNIEHEEMVDHVIDKLTDFLEKEIDVQYDGENDRATLEIEGNE